MLDPIDPFPQTIAFGILHTRALVMFDRLKALDQDLCIHLNQLDMLDLPDNLSMSVKQVYVPAQIFQERELHDLVVFCSYTNNRLRGSYRWTHMQQLWALFDLLTFVQSEKMGAIVDMLPFSENMSDMKEKHHKNGYLLKAIDEGQFFYPYMLMPSRYAPLVKAAAIQSPITMLWNAPLPALSKTGVFMTWYEEEGLH